MMNSAKAIITLLLVLTALTRLTAQQPMDVLIKTFNEYRTHRVQEKVYVHTDREFYVTGEFIWFRIYCADGVFNRPLDLSKVVYVDILDRGNKRVLEAKISINTDGIGSGSLFIPATIASGNYTLRAYTQWMRNYAPEFYFRKTLTIVNPFIKPDLVKTKPLPSRQVAFFPEGGRLVSGLKSNIGFTVTDEHGRGLDCSGQVFTDAGDTVARFSTLRFGIGRFELLPETGRDYKVRIVDRRNNASIHSIPTSEPAGYVMRVGDEGNHLAVNVDRAGDGTSGYVYLFTHSRNVVSFAQAMSLTPSASITIPKDKLQPGITHITIFDDRLQPVCERLYFKAPERLQVSVNSEQQDYSDRQSITVSIHTAHDGPLPASLSVSVYRDDSLAAMRHEDIHSYLWLTSDLAGTVESPEYYLLTDSSAAHAEAVDNLMLTHGWRRFAWEDVLNKKPAVEFIPEYRGHIIGARITTPEGEPASGVLAYMSSPDKIIRIYPSVSNRKGLLRFEAIQFPGPRDLYLQAESEKPYKFYIESPFSDVFADGVTPPLFEISSSALKSLTERMIGMQVQDIFVENSRERYITSGIDSLSFYGIADETYLLDDYTRFPVMEEVMREYVPGVLVRKRRDGFHFLVEDVVNKTVMQSDPLILLDGVRVRSADAIMQFDPRKVRKLEVVTRPYFLGPATFYGIVSYTTYGGDLGGFEMDPSVVRIDYDGLQLQREFYSPTYDTPTRRNNHSPDQRTLLYWNPDIRTDTSGNASIRFYSGDLQGRYIIRVEGTSHQGISGSSVSTFRVKRFDN